VRPGAGQSRPKNLPRKTDAQQRSDSSADGRRNIEDFGFYGDRWSKVALNESWLPTGFGISGAGVAHHSRTVRCRQAPRESAAAGSGTHRREASARRPQEPLRQRRDGVVSRQDSHPRTGRRERRTLQADRRRRRLRDLRTRRRRRRAGHRLGRHGSTATTCSKSRSTAPRAAPSPASASVPSRARPRRQSPSGTPTSPRTTSSARTGPRSPTIEPSRTPSNSSGCSSFVTKWPTNRSPTTSSRARRASSSPNSATSPGNAASVLTSRVSNCSDAHSGAAAAKRPCSSNAIGSDSVMTRRSSRALAASTSGADA